jgi:parallel beta-helix repeat protein
LSIALIQADNSELLESYTSPEDNISQQTSRSIRDYATHQPIYIHGNENFSSNNGVTTGDGSRNNPYIIKDWKINASNEHGIALRNISAYFIIENCYIQNGGNYYDGIIFYNVSYSIIRNNIITKNRNGISFQPPMYGEEDSDNNIIVNNSIIYNLMNGISFEHLGGNHHSENIISYNDVSLNGGNGTFMVMSENNTISYNIFRSNRDHGVCLNMCDGGGDCNKIHHNDFIYNNNNQTQASSWGHPTNFWNNATEGNYWSDYRQIYPNATNNGKVWDTSYEINSWEYANDSYPLVNPVNKSQVLSTPIARIESITPNPAVIGQEIFFNGSAIDYDGFVIDYQWLSSIDGLISTEALFSTYHLTIGNHTISFAVKDNEGIWSEVVFKQLSVITHAIKLNYTLHEPIKIVGNYEFTIENGVVAGGGTDKDPFIIEGWEINGSLSDYCIAVVNTSANFIIRNCYLRFINYYDEMEFDDIVWPYEFIQGAISINNVTNGMFENNMLFRSNYGVNIISSSNLLIQNNTIINGFIGIKLKKSSENYIQNNTILNGTRGIYSEYSHYNFISNNSCFNYDSIYLTSSNNNTILNNKCPNGYKGIRLINANNNTISKNICDENYYAGIELFNSSDNSLFDNICEFNTFYGINIEKSEGIIFNKNYCLSNRYKGINLEDSLNISLTRTDFYFNNLYFSNSTKITLNNNYFYESGLMIKGKNKENYDSHNIDNSNIVNSKLLIYWANQNSGTIKDEVGQLILANCSNIVVEHLNINNTNIGIILAFSTNCYIQYNNCSNNIEKGIHIYNSSLNYINQNNFNFNGEHPSGYGMYLVDSADNNSILNNTCNSNGYFGIYLLRASGNQISDNYCLNSYYGINLHYLDNNNSILNNNLSRNTIGIMIDRSSSNILAKNFIDSNDWLGMSIRDSIENIIQYNNISNNEDGIWINNYHYSSYNNIVHHNNFIENLNQLYDDEGTNQWDDGTGEGNYWSDYTGIDNGENGHTAGDGVGDTKIPHLGIDYYPLMEPYEEPTQYSIQIILELSKLEFQTGESITGSVTILNDNSFRITLEDPVIDNFSVPPAHFYIYSTNYYASYYGITEKDINRIEIEAQSTEYIEFNIENHYGNNNINNNLEPGNYTIFSQFFIKKIITSNFTNYDLNDFIDLDSNYVNFKVIENKSIGPGSGGSSSSNGDRPNTRKNQIIGSIVAFTVVIVFISTIFVLSTEFGKYKFFAAMGAMYSKARKKKKKDHEYGYIKGSIRGYILGNPGESYNSIKRILDLPNGTLAYYLKVLETERIIRSERDGFLRRFYPIGGNFSSDILELTELQENIKRIIQNQPGISQKDILAQMEDISQQKMNYHIQLLEKARIIKIDRTGKGTQCFIIEEEPVKKVRFQEVT